MGWVGCHSDIQHLTCLHPTETPFPIAKEVPRVTSHWHGYGHLCPSVNHCSQGITVLSLEAPGLVPGGKVSSAQAIRQAGKGVTPLRGAKGLLKSLYQEILGLPTSWHIAECAVNNKLSCYAHCMDLCSSSVETGIPKI